MLCTDLGLLHMVREGDALQLLHLPRMPRLVLLPEASEEAPRVGCKALGRQIQERMHEDGVQ